MKKLRSYPKNDIRIMHPMSTKFINHINYRPIWRGYTSTGRKSGPQTCEQPMSIYMINPDNILIWEYNNIGLYNVQQTVSFERNIVE